MTGVLSRRRVDLFYAAFLILHLLTILAFDSQVFLPARLYHPYLVDKLTEFGREWGEPFMPGAWTGTYRWFLFSVIKEFVFDLPIFLVGSWGLIRGHQAIYPLLIAYCSIATFTAFQCIFQLFAGPEGDDLTGTQVRLLLSAYGPWLIVPTIMLIDLLHRTTSLLTAGDAGHDLSVQRKRK